VLLTNNIEGVQNNTRIARYPKTQIISLEKSLLGGVYDEEKYHSNGQGEKKKILVNQNYLQKILYQNFIGNV
jgi:hypothetical protein